MMAMARRDTRFRLSEERARELAGEFGTPLYVVDEGHFRGRIRRYKAACEAAEPGSKVVYASKANSTLAVLAIAHQEGCQIDVASEGELRAALAAGVSASSCHLHGNNKQRSEIEIALEAGIGEIVIDNFGEIETIAEEIDDLRFTNDESPDNPKSKIQNPKSEVPGGLHAPGSDLRPSSFPLLLRLAPGVDPITHHKISTGQADTKFGFNIADGSAERATLRCLELGLPLVGFHCHVGSQLLDPEAQRSGGELIARFASDMKRKHGFEAKVLNVGGGLGVRYTDEDEPMEPEEYCRLVFGAMRKGLEGSGLDPVLVQEPGRWLIAESGVTLYTIGVVKSVPIGDGRMRTYVSVDGGMSDNPRPALYGARYTVERIAPAVHGQDGHVAPAMHDQDGHATSVSGKHCETDLLFPDVSLPSETAPGDLLQVLATGAYSSSMASNYNRYPRPATVLNREDGRFDLIQRRESFGEMLAREVVPEDLGRGA